MGDTKRKQDSRRPQIPRSDENIGTIENLIFSQEIDPGTHLRLREIEMDTGKPRVFVHRIAKFDLGLIPTTFKQTIVQRLTTENEKKRIERGKMLLRYMVLPI